MHELPVTKSILGIVLRHAEARSVRRVLAINLAIGALSDLEAEWLQSYFDLLSRGTVAEGAELRVHRSPLTFRCESCFTEYTATREELDTAVCSHCGSRDAAIVGGTGYTVESMEAEE
ncbi:MAG: hydrogenase maturation nickel metallochaperone HypA [Gemmatimonadota bacterium]|jgi:hydrogenase nickel incorporation protein HypA/HybF